MPAEDELKLVLKLIGQEDLVKGLKGVSDTVKKTGDAVKGSVDKQTEGFNKLGSSVIIAAWQFRYLGNMFQKFSQQMVRGITDVVKVSAELQESFLSIDIAAVMFGQDVDRATKFVKELSLTGLIPLTAAADAVDNLMVTGIGLPEMERFTYRYLDVATLFTSGMDEMEKSICESYHFW